MTTLLLIVLFTVLTVLAAAHASARWMRERRRPIPIRANRRR